jgi:hypothetical protein
MLRFFKGGFVDEPCVACPSGADSVAGAAGLEPEVCLWCAGFEEMADAGLECVACAG